MLLIDGGQIHATFLTFTWWRPLWWHFKDIYQTKLCLQSPWHLWFGQVKICPRHNWERPFWRPVSSHFYFTFHNSGIKGGLVKIQVSCINRTLVIWVDASQETNMTLPFKIFLFQHPDIVSFSNFSRVALQPCPLHVSAVQEGKV